MCIQRIFNAIKFRAVEFIHVNFPLCNDKKPQNVYWHTECTGWIKNSKRLCQKIGTTSMLKSIDYAREQESKLLLALKKHHGDDDNDDDNNDDVKLMMMMITMPPKTQYVLFCLLFFTWSFFTQSLSLGLLLVTLVVFSNLFAYFFFYSVLLVLGGNKWKICFAANREPNRYLYTYSFNMMPCEAIIYLLHYYVIISFFEFSCLLLFWYSSWLWK